MSDREAEIEKLSAEIGSFYYAGDREAAASVAERLANLLGNSSPNAMDRHIQSWIQIWEARGNLREAIRLANIDIARKRTEIENGDFDAYPNLLREEVEYLQDNLYLQAGRYEEVGDHKTAIECLEENLAMGTRYDIRPDEDVLDLFASLISK